MRPGADAAFACRAVQEKYPTVFKYTQSILAIPAIKSVYGDVAFAVESPLVGKL